MSLGALIAFAGAVRVFSADYCADQLVLALADRGQIAALSVDAEKDFSYLREASHGLPQARAGAEEIHASNAGLVLRTWGGDAIRIERLGVRVVTLGYAADVSAIKENVRVAARALGQIERGERLAGEIDKRLAALKAKGPTGVEALYVTPGGVTAGAGTIIDAIFNAAGVQNIAAKNGLTDWPPLSAETLIDDPPQFIVTGFFSANSERIDHWSATRHPAIRRAIEQAPHVELAADTLACPGFFSLDAAETIRKAADHAAQ